MFQDPFITLHRLRDSQSLTIYGDAEFNVDAVGNLSVSWTDPLASRASPARLTRAHLAGFLSEHVEQHRNRAGAYLCITDALGALLKVTWREVDPWAGQLLDPQELYGVAALSGAVARSGSDSLSLVIYRADYRFGRGSGLLETRPEP